MMGYMLFSSSVPHAIASILESKFSVSRETLHLLERYITLVHEWNQKFNLISRSTLPDIWHRHLLDSVQLLPLLPPHIQTLTDLGSGAGFPGIVLSILGIPEVHLIESTQKKALFLREASLLAPHPAHIHCARIEKLVPWENDVITARALAPLDKIFTWGKTFIQKSKLCLFLKGRNVMEEIKAASHGWVFDYELIPSLTDPHSRIVAITNLHSRTSL